MDAQIKQIKYVAYYLLYENNSIQKNNLSIQTKAIKNATTNGEIIATFTDVYPKIAAQAVKKNLIKAIKECMKNNAILVIGDFPNRLKFYLKLKVSNIKFFSPLDPYLNNKTIDLFIMEQSTWISNKWFKPNIKVVMEPNTKELFDLVVQLKDKDNKTYEQIAKYLNQEGYKTTKNKQFFATTVLRIYKQKFVKNRSV